MGKLAHCLPVVAQPRLPGSTGPIPEALASVQVAINNVARSVVGHNREDHVLIVDLLEAAKFLSLNQQVVRAMAACNAYVSHDGTDRYEEPSRRPHVRQRQPAYNKTDQSNSNRRGPGPDRGHGHPRDPRSQDVERMRGAARLQDQG
jgi:hypothetical protein